VGARTPEYLTVPVANKERIAVVLPGGGARGAYEIGALSRLLPELARRGESVTIFCGTSVGAINAVLLASLADLPVSRQVAVALERWLGIRHSDVVRRVLAPHTLLRIAGGLASTVRGRRAAITSLLDAGPLAGNIGRWVDFGALHRHVAAGTVDAVSVIATSLGAGRPVAFVESHKRRTGGVSEDITYVRASLGPEHVRASAAIPIFFRPVHIGSPAAAAGWYVDGGTRLNTPIKPALDLGAGKVIVIGFEPLVTTAAAARDGDTPRPVLIDVIANALDGLLLDEVRADMTRMAAVNAFFVDDQGAGPVGAARAYREARGRHAYRRVRYALITPSTQGTLASIAREVLTERYAGLRGLARADHLAVLRLLAPGRRSTAELSSFLLFDEEYIARLIDAGRSDADAWLARHPGFWCADPAHDFELDPKRAAREREIADFQEWRAITRR
jgi:NTE family protein